MTLEEAKKIAEIFETADGYCYSCAADLAERADKVFPEFIWICVDGDISVEIRPQEIPPNAA